MHYQQLCGALGMLKTAGQQLPWGELNSTLRNLAVMPTYEMEAAAEPLLRQYRDICLSLGLIGRGELFSADDCVPLI